MKPRSVVVIASCIIFIVCAALSALATAQANQTKSQTTASVNVQGPASDESAEGEKLFRTHCGRCHNPPENLSPREVRAVVRHMRVRATLTSDEEKLIVKFLAP